MSFPDTVTVRAEGCEESVPIGVRSEDEDQYYCSGCSGGEGEVISRVFCGMIRESGPASAP